MFYPSHLRYAVLAVATCALVQPSLRGQDPLQSWEDGPTKSAIVDFVSRVTTPGNPHFVPLEERIATFEKVAPSRLDNPTHVR